MHGYCPAVSVDEGKNAMLPSRFQIRDGITSPSSFNILSDWFEFTLEVGAVTDQSHSCSETKFARLKCCVSTLTADYLPDTSLFSTSLAG